MNLVSSRALRSAFLALALSILAGAGQVRAEAPAAPPPIESFFGNPVMAGATLSPDSQRLAVRVSRKGKRDGLAVIELATRAVKLVAAFDDGDVDDFSWVSNDRLLFNAWEDTRSYPGLHAINADGSDYRKLANRTNYAMRTQRGAQNSPFIYVERPHYDITGQLDNINLLRLSTISGDTTTVQRPRNTRQWVLDQNGEPRIAVALEGEMSVTYYLDPATRAWRKLAQHNAYTGEADAQSFAPYCFGPDGTLYVTARAGGDKVALYRFDIASGKRDAEPLVQLQDYDFDGDLVIVNNKLLGVRVLADARATIWFDAGMKALQQRVDKLLPGMINEITMGQRAQGAWVLVSSSSDIHPPRWHLFNADTGALDKVGEAYPGIDPARMGRQQALRYPARDGLSIPAMLTLPQGGQRKNLPMVVLVHGGPFLRGAEWNFDPEVQFLASRGYAVLQPEYRGSTGFGASHFRAGWKQWGLKMQDDIADGAGWAIAQGIADPARICIAGASYGGYAALMGLINDPDLYKCGVDWLGVTDIGLLYTGGMTFFSGTSDAYQKYGMPRLVGDLEADAVQLKATSPLQQAARIRQPLLLAYGGADGRVPLAHGRQFHDAVKATNKQVEMVVYDEEGHGWTLPKNRIDFWSRVEKFLAKNIGKP